MIHRRLHGRFGLALAAVLAGATLAAPAGPPARAQSSGIDIGRSGGAVEIDADQGIEWRRDEKIYIARGNVRAARGELALYADTLTARYRDNGNGTEIYQIEAVGDVRLTTAEDTVFGDRATYNLDRDLVLFEGGDLRIETPNQTMTARDALEYWTERKVLVARGEAVVRDADRKISASTLTGYFKENDAGALELYQVEAAGDVRLAGNRTYARGAKAVYNLEAKVATLSGNVRISRGNAQLSGARAEVNLKTGVSRLLGGGATRVHTLIIPGKKPAQ